MPAELLAAPWKNGKEKRRLAADFLFQREVLSTAKDSFADTKTGETLQKEWNIFVAFWVASVSILKRLFGILPIKTAILKYKVLLDK